MPHGSHLAPPPIVVVGASAGRVEALRDLRWAAVRSPEQEADRSDQLRQRAAAAGREHSAGRLGVPRPDVLA